MVESPCFNYLLLYCINIILCFRPTFGIYRVDFNDENRSRYPKKSLQFFKQLFQSKILPDVLEDLYYCKNEIVQK